MSSPVDADLLKRVKKAYTHAFCPDGLSSAMIVSAAYGLIGMSPEIVFVTYDKPEHDNAPREEGQLWVDITPPYRKWEEWKGLSPVVLDHHETAKPAVDGLGGVYGGLEDSGASLAFRHVMRNLNPGRDDLEKWAKFAYLCMLRDTWKDTNEDWEEAGAVANAIMFYTQKALLVSSADGRLDLDEVIRFGKVLMKKAANKAFRLGQTSFFRTALGLKFGFFNCTEKLISETGHELIDKHGCDVAVGFFYSFENGSYDANISFRSKKGGVPVNKMAEHFGGGGHQPAAACRIKGASGLSFDGLMDVVLEAAEAALAKA